MTPISWVDVLGIAAFFAALAAGVALWIWSILRCPPRWIEVVALGGVAFPIATMALWVWAMSALGWA